MRQQLVLRNFEQSKINILAKQYGLPFLNTGACLAYSILYDAYGDNALEKIQNEIKVDGKNFFEKLILLQTQMQFRQTQVDIDLETFIKSEDDPKNLPANEIKSKKRFGCMFTTKKNESSHIVNILLHDDNSCTLFDTTFGEITCPNLEYLFLNLKDYYLPQKYIINNFRIFSFDLYNYINLTKYPLTVSTVTSESKLPILKYLVEEKGANVNTPACDGTAPIFAAIMLNSLETIKYLISKKVDLTQLDTDGASVIHQAVKTNQPSIIEFLIENGANINQKNAKDETTLQSILADKATSSKFEIIKMLLANGAKVELKDICKSIEELPKSFSQTSAFSLLIKSFITQNVTKYTKYFTTSYIPHICYAALIGGSALSAYAYSIFNTKNDEQSRII